ncbi:MAG: hypothetical protein N4A38_04100 [Candidatus Gracilibacteria bacterium]|nr:hypothetical protein [Candidatus Gracilibacteria bacterium]
MDFIEKTKEKINDAILNNKEIAPFLFLSDNLVKTNLDVFNLAQSLFDEHKISKYNLISLNDNGERIKTEQARELLYKSHQKPGEGFQIFIIENISRLNINSGNALLKFLEEPGYGNIILLTNAGENNILDTIISRVSKIYLSDKKVSSKNEFYYNLLDRFVKKQDNKLASYFYSEKLEKSDYLDFLKTFIIYSKENLVFTEFLDNIEEKINAIEKTNVLSKYVVDDLIFKLQNKL